MKLTIATDTFTLCIIYLLQHEYEKCTNESFDKHLKEQYCSDSKYTIIKYAKI